MNKREKPIDTNAEMSSERSPIEEKSKGKKTFLARGSGTAGGKSGFSVTRTQKK